MKKKLWFFFLFFPFIASSQEISVRKIQQITGTKDGELVLSGVSPDGKHILASSSDFRGLKIIDVKRKRIKEIAIDAGAGYEPAFSTDGNKIYFRSDEYKNYRKYSTLYEYDRTVEAKSQVEPASRGLGSPVISGSEVIYMADGKRRTRSTGKDVGGKGDSYIYVSLEELVPVLYSGGKRKEVKPNGDGNYIWASLSPDRKKLLYNFRGTSTFVSDTAGNILQELGRVNAPRWIDNNLIAGMNDEDDGTRVLRSDIICYSLKTNKLYNLTNTVESVEMYPFPLTGKNRVAFQTLKGELYIMNIKIR
jgi:Tol biopolymer transport system component